MTEPDNRIVLRGRVADRPEARTLPSGDVVVALRLIVDRSTTARRRSRQSVDTFDCSLWTARLRAAAVKLAAGDRIEVAGELRRSFSRGGRGVTSRVFVDVGTLKRLPKVPVASSA